jgi:hypothetical protein
MNEIIEIVVILAMLFLIPSHNLNCNPSKFMPRNFENAFSWMLNLEIQE